MSHLLDTYRRNAAAAAAHREAERSHLPNTRQRFVEAAERWTGLADRLEVVEARQQERGG